MTGLSQLELASTPRQGRYDAVVIGSGPNGLAAAITVAREGQKVLVVEAKETVGGGMRSAELTLPGFVHDVCSAIHAMAVVSPFFRSLPLDQFGVNWITPPVAVAHPLDGGAAAVNFQSFDDTVASLAGDGPAYRSLLQPLVDHSDQVFKQLLGPFRPPRHPCLMSRFGWSAMKSASRLARKRFESEAARALFAGHAAHSIMPLERRLTAAFGIMLAVTAHAGGWPVAQGGSQMIADAMARYLMSLDGELVVNMPVERLEDLPEADAYFFDTSPQALSHIAGNALPSRYRRKLERFRFGPGIFKVDWALDGPIPWQAQQCLQAGTVHVGGTLEEICESEQAAWGREASERPFVLVAQQSLFDTTRSPEGKQVAWGYCHVPSGSTTDMTAAIENQIERFAPGFNDLILARHTMTTCDLQSHNANYIGGDITGGVMDFRQFLARPTFRWTPYRTPNNSIYLCSASTPPGGGVHGMCGFHAAKAALRVARSVKNTSDRSGTKPKVH